MLRSLRLLAPVAISAAVAFASQPAAAVVVCQKGKAVKLRSSQCRKKEVTVGDLGADLAGVWDHREGSALVSDAFVPSFLTLQADGSGQLNRRSSSPSQILTCRSLLYARGGGVPTLTLQESVSAPNVVQAALEGPDVLRITSRSGTSLFDRVDSVDPAEECLTLSEVSRLSGLPAPAFGSTGLAFDGTRFVYRDDSGPVIVDAATGAIGTPPILPSTARTPHAAEGGDIWGTCRCGLDDVATRATLAGVTLDTVATTEVLGSSLKVVALALPAPGQLLLLTQEIGAAVFIGRLARIDTAAEPDTLISEVDFDDFLLSMAHDGTSLWAIRFADISSVLRIDPETGLATGTFLIPDATVQWSVVAAAGGQLFVGGEAADGQGVIATFTAP